MFYRIHENLSYHGQILYPGSILPLSLSPEASGVLSDNGTVSLAPDDSILLSELHCDCFPIEDLEIIGVVTVAELLTIDSTDLSDLVALSVEDIESLKELARQGYNADPIRGCGCS